MATYLGPQMLVRKKVGWKDKSTSFESSIKGLSVAVIVTSYVTHVSCHVKQ